MVEYIYYGLIFLAILSFIGSLFFGGVCDIFNFLSLMSFGAIFVLTYVIGSNYSLAADNQAIINKYQPIVDKYKTYKDNFILDSKSINTEGDVVFSMNADTPIKAHIDNYHEVNKAMLNASIKVDLARVEIEAIRLGVFGFVVKWVENK